MQLGGAAINATTAYAIAGGVAGFVSGAAGASLYGANAKDALKAGGRGAVSGALFGGVTGFYGDTWNTGRVLANGVAGGAASDINGGSFKEGFRLSAALSLMTLANYKMRAAMIKQSRLNLDNIGKESEGFFGDGIGIAGTRRVLNPDYGEVDGALKYLICDGQAGGCQGPQIEGAISVSSHLGPISYSNGDLLDLVSESFAGPHDWLSDQAGMYDSLGNGIRRTGFMKELYETISYGLISVAAPFSVAGIIDTTNGMHSYLYSVSYRKNEAL